MDSRGERVGVGRGANDWDPELAFTEIGLSGIFPSPNTGPKQGFHGRRSLAVPRKGDRMAKHRQQNSNMLGVSIVVCGIVTAIAWGVTNPQIREKVLAYLPVSKQAAEDQETAKKSTSPKQRIASQESDPIDTEASDSAGDASAGVASLDEADEVPVSRGALPDNVDNPFEDNPTETRQVSNEVQRAAPKQKQVNGDPFADFETGETPVEAKSPPRNQSKGMIAKEVPETELSNQEKQQATRGGEDPFETPTLTGDEQVPELTEENAQFKRESARTRTSGRQRGAVRGTAAQGTIDTEPVEIESAQEEFEKPSNRAAQSERPTPKSRQKITRLNYEESSEPQELDLNQLEEASPQMSEEPVEDSQEETEGGLDLSIVRRMIQNGDDMKAHRILSDWYWKFPENRALFQKDLDDLATRIYFSPQPHYEEPYLIQPGDRLSNIANEYQVSWRYLSKLNQVDPRKIRAGKKLKVFQGPFSVVIDLSDFELTVHNNGLYVKQYKIGIGKQNSSPVGEFSVREKLENPTYYGTDGNVVDADDPLNPLGERWIDIGDGFGIHGTVDPRSVGGMHSKGCIRMLNSDVEEVYDLLTLGSSVKIQR